MTTILNQFHNKSTFSLFGGLASAIRHHFSKRALAGELEGLSDRVLKDAGICRDSIQEHVRQAHKASHIRVANEEYSCGQLSPRVAYSS
jgi:uncharacterized protein YjiS (DUF1127 family)